MQWHVQLELRGTLNEEQMEAAAAGWQSAAFLGTGEITLRGDVDADTVEEAATIATARLRGAPALAELLDAGTITGPHRVTIEDEEAFAAGLPMVGMAEAALALGYSPAYLRKLRASDPGFPAPALQLATGDVWRTADLIAYDKTRPRGQRGRPRKEAVDVLKETANEDVRKRVTTEVMDQVADGVSTPDRAGLARRAVEEAIVDAG